MARVAAQDALSLVYAHESEKSFQARVVRAAETFGWLVQHQRISIGSAAGWPDLALCRRERLIFAELKRQSGKLTDAQWVWLHALEAAGQTVYVWRPSDWDTLVELLR